jgi:hypothetical protein
MVKQNNFINKAIMNTQECFMTLERNTIDIFANFNEIRNRWNIHIHQTFMEKSITAVADYLMKGIEDDMTKSDH